MPSPLPSCFAVLNDAYFSNLLAEIAAIGSASDLQTLVNKVFSELSILESTITSQYNFLALLLTAPTDLPSVITWITNFIAQLTDPYAKLAAQLTALGVQIGLLTAAINAAATRLNASINIPAITIGCQL